MSLAPPSLTPLWIAWGCLVLLAFVARSRTYATALAIFLGVALLIWSGLQRHLSSKEQLVLFVFAVITLVHYASLVRPRLRPRWLRASINIPGLWFFGGTVLAFPWAIAGGLGYQPYGWWLPFALCLIGILQSFRNREEVVDLVIDNQHVPTLQPMTKGPAIDGEHLRIVQITDPHLGPFMSVARLRRICERAVSREPDVIAITGDLLTMESQAAPHALAHALEPLTAANVPILACFGNHDHEARATVRAGISAIGGILLVDESIVIETRIGPVEIVGSDFRWRDRQTHLAALFDAVGAPSEVPRILLLHDPGAFRHVPDGAADLTLSGHTHGGQLGLLSLGLRWTILRWTSSMPDHGLWAVGRNRLYVHRGTGHYGFPVRLGVPGEESTLRVAFRRG